MCGNKPNYSLGISTLSGTCQLTSCDKLDFSVRRYMREGSRLRVVSKLVFSTFWQLLQNGYLVSIRINAIQVGPSINGVCILSTWTRGNIPSTLVYFLFYIGSWRAQSTMKYSEQYLKISSKKVLYWRSCLSSVDGTVVVSQPSTGWLERHNQIKNDRVVTLCRGLKWLRS